MGSRKGGMIMFSIGSVVSVEDPSSFREIPDDRVQNVPCIDDVYLEDLGIVPAGTTYEVTLTITNEDYAALLAYRGIGAKPAIVDHRGNNLGFRSFKIKGATYVEGCAFRQVELEILRG